MSTGYGWEGTVMYVRRCLVRVMYLSASAVALSIWGAITNVHLYLFKDPDKIASIVESLTRVYLFT